MTNPPACLGDDPALFDSILWTDHLEARKACGICPRVADCLQTARSIAAEHSPGNATVRGPDGTWAGQLWQDGRVVLHEPTPCGTDSGYHSHRYRKQKPCDECRLAHNQVERIRARRKKVA